MPTSASGCERASAASRPAAGSAARCHCLRKRVAASADGWSAHGSQPAPRLRCGARLARSIMHSCTGRSAHGWSADWRMDRLSTRQPRRHTPLHPPLPPAPQQCPPASHAAAQAPHPAALAAPPPPSPRASAAPSSPAAACCASGATPPHGTGARTTPHERPPGVSQSRLRKTTHSARHATGTLPTRHFSPRLLRSPHGRALANGERPRVERPRVGASAHGSIKERHAPVRGALHHARCAVTPTGRSDALVFITDTTVPGVRRFTGIYPQTLMHSLTLLVKVQ